MKLFTKLYTKLSTKIVRKILPTLITIIFITTLGGCSDISTDQARPSPEDPVSISVWHYYNGAQQAAFDQLVTEFNRTEGLEQGIYVTGYGQGDLSSLETKVRASVDQEVGSDPMPNIFSSYADVAYEIEQKGLLADIGQYLTEAELDEYVDSYIDEGRIGHSGELRIFPIAKSTEVLMINKTDWTLFADETGAELSQLDTWEGMADVAQKYYEWTDAQTPEVLDDGQAFYGRDVMANHFLISAMQLDAEIFTMESADDVNNPDDSADTDNNDSAGSSRIVINLDEEVMRRIWDYYYIPYIEGYYNSFGRFRSDDLKIGQIIAYSGSTASAMYFPDEVEKEEGVYPIEYLILPDPIFEGGDRYAVLQGAGMVISKATPEEEYASATFLKWFTRTENNIAFGCTAGYLPVLKSASSKANLDAVIADRGLTVSPKTYDTITTVLDHLADYTLYSAKTFEGAAAARNVLEYHLQDKATADRATVVSRLAEGMDRSAATADFLTDEAFAEWYRDLQNELNRAVLQSEVQ